MAERDPTVPQSDDPDLQADVVRLLRIVGPLGRFNVADVIVPVFQMGTVTPLDVEVLQPIFRSTEVFSGGVIIAPAAGAVLADTTALAAGDYDVRLVLTSNDTQSFASSRYVVEHRNAANAANLAVWNYLVTSGDAANSFKYESSFGYQVAANERLRVIAGPSSEALRAYSCVIFARRRT